MLQESDSERRSVGSFTRSHQSQTGLRYLYCTKENELKARPKRERGFIYPKVQEESSKYESTIGVDSSQEKSHKLRVSSYESPRVTGSESI